MKLTKAERKALQNSLDAQWEASRDEKVKELIKRAINFCKIELMTQNETGTPEVGYKFFNYDLSYDHEIYLRFENCSKAEFEEVEWFVDRCQEHSDEIVKETTLKLNAIKKLTPEERVALGIKI